MGLKRRGSLEVADKVLSLLDKDTRLQKYFNSEDVYVGAFKNGREHGYAIMVDNDNLSNEDSAIQISFAEYRSSDDIVVYEGKPDYTSLEEALLKPKYFGYNQHQKAVDYIVERIVTHMSKKG